MLSIFHMLLCLSFVEEKRSGSACRLFSGRFFPLSGSNFDTKTFCLASQSVPIHKGGATSFERPTGRPHRSPSLPLFAMVECLVPSDRKPERVLEVVTGAPERSDQSG